MCENLKIQDRQTGKTARAGVALNGKRPIAATIFILLAGVVCLANPHAGAPSISNAFAGSDRTRDEQRMWQWTRDWIKLRREHSAVRHGRLIDLSYDDDVYAYARQDSTQTIIILINRSGKEINTRIPSAAIGLRNGTKLSPLNYAKTAVVTANGEARIGIPAKSAVAYRN